MGATIDYAIVLLSHYQQNRGTMEKRPAMVKALTDSFVTVITSGIIMTAAGLLIAWRVSDVYVCHIGLAVGRGALISVILVLTVLPQLLVLLDKPVMKTTFRLRKKN
jgi:Predicted exporters of the RND superfamily